MSWPGGATKDFGEYYHPRFFVPVDDLGPFAAHLFPFYPAFKRVGFSQAACFVLLLLLLPAENTLT